MQIAKYISVLISFLVLFVFIVMLILGVKDSFEIAVTFFIFLVGGVWAIYGLFRLFLLALYHTRKAWLLAEQDAHKFYHSEQDIKK